MGQTITNLHIHNSAGLTKAQFKKAFADMMKQRGFVKATADAATVSYSLVFSKDRKWVTVTGEDLNAAEFAKSLGSQVLSVELVDSDFAELKLHAPDGSADTLMLGESYSDEYPEPNPDAWESVLGENSWSKVKEIQSSDCTFAEDILADFGQLVGLGENILTDGEELPESAETLYFKKAKEKKLTFNSAFVKVYGEYFESLVFKKMKGKATYVKLVDNEVILAFSCYKFKDIHVSKPIDPSYILTHDMNKFMTPPNNIINKHMLQLCQQFHIEPCFDEKLLQQYDVGFRVATVYDDNPFCGGDSILSMYKKTNKYNIDRNYRLKIWNFSYLKESEESLLASMMYTFDLTKKFFVPFFDKINSFEDAIDYHSHNVSPLIITKWYIKWGNYKEKLNEWLKSEKSILLSDREKYPYHEKLQNIDEELEGNNMIAKRVLEVIDEIENDPERYNKLMSKMEENRKRNMELLECL